MLDKSVKAILNHESLDKYTNSVATPGRGLLGVRMINSL